jgi:hypothetical protein
MEMEVDKLFLEYVGEIIKTIREEYSVSEVEAQRLLIVGFDENELEIFRSIETALRNKKWFATAPERLLARKRSEADPY